jgi:uncharacterized protein YyaL (SSP411 family)
VAAVRWLSWSANAFARARDEDKPVLLSIVAPWCATSARMDRTSYANDAVCTLVNDRFVPIRVDADRRPDISERYSLGGWPTTAFLTADGMIVGGGTFVTVDRMPSVLERVLDAFTSRRDEILSNSQRTRTMEERQPSPDVELLSVVFDSFDREHGGFGTEPKFPVSGPLELALTTYGDSQDAEMARIVETTLDAMGWGALYDEIDGGFFRCAARRDWHLPHQEKLLSVNAQLLRLYVEAGETLRAARYREKAADVLRYVQTWLADQADGGWAGSQHSDDVYYSAGADERRATPPPPVDGAFYAGWNAAMASAVLRIAEALDDASVGEFALKSLERVLLGCYTPGGGVAHCLEEHASVRGLLDDQIAMAAAQLDAHAATGNVVYQMMAQELVHYALRTMWDDREGGFFDRSVPDEQDRIGLMDERLKPFVTNCEAVRVLRRLAETTGDREFDARADATLAVLAPLAAGQGPLAAHYLLARRPLQSK